MGARLFTQLPLCIWSEVDLQPVSSKCEKRRHISHLVSRRIVVAVLDDLQQCFQSLNSVSTTLAHGRRNLRDSGWPWPAG
jgi:hypothetical protein